MVTDLYKPSLRGHFLSLRGALRRGNLVLKYRNWLPKTEITTRLLRPGKGTRNDDAQVSSSSPAGINSRRSGLLLPVTAVEAPLPVTGHRSPVTAFESPSRATSHQSLVTASRVRRGFTLTELIMAVAIIGILSSLGGVMFIQVNRFIILNRTRIELQREARMILSLINRNLRQGQFSTILIDRAANQPYYSRIFFTRMDGVSYTFYQQNKHLFMISGTVTRELSDNLRFLSFTPPRSEDLTIISVALTLEKGTYESKTKALHMASEKVMVMN